MGSETGVAVASNVGALVEIGVGSRVGSPVGSTKGSVVAVAAVGTGMEVGDAAVAVGARVAQEVPWVRFRCMQRLPDRQSGRLIETLLKFARKLLY